MSEREREMKGEKERELGVKAVRHMGCIKGLPGRWWAGKHTWVLCN